MKPPAASDRITIVQRFYEAVRMQLITGSADTERLYHWSFRFLDAQRDTGESETAYEAHLARMQRLEKDVTHKFEKKLVSQLEHDQAVFFRVEAEYWLALTREEDYVALAEQQLELGRRIHEAARSHFLQTAEGIEGACLWSVRLLQAERDYGQTEEKDCYQAHLGRVLDVEQEARRQLRSGKVEQVMVSVADFFRWEAEYWLSLCTGRRGRSRAFAEMRLQAARDVYKSVREGFQAGVGMAEHLYLWSLRGLRASRDHYEESGGDNEAVRHASEVGALEDHGERMLTLQSELRSSLPIGVALDLGALEYFVLEARCWIQRARIGQESGFGMRE
jgi:hypothetical protein